MKTLAELYCERHRVPTALFDRHILNACLYPQARWFKNILTVLRPDYFEPDLELVRATGLLTRPGGFAAEVSEYSYHSDNAGRLRREWKLRLSVTRLRAIVLDLLGEEPVTVESLAPFATIQTDPVAGPALVRVRVSNH
jgi:hypothetical protein